MSKRSARVTILQKDLRHIVDALSAASAAGLTSDIQQAVFDMSVMNAGGIVKLSRLAGMKEEKPYKPNEEIKAHV